MDNLSPFEKLLLLDNSVTVHQRNIQVLATELFKVKNNLSPDIMNTVFIKNQQSAYNLRNESYFRREHKQTVYFGTESLSFLGPQIWDLLSDEVKNLDNLDSFKAAIKKWTTENCPCRLCKLYVANVGFV